MHKEPCHISQTAGAIFQLLNKGTMFKEEMVEFLPYSDADIEAMFDFISL